MTVAQKLIALGFKPEKDFICRDDGEGAYIYIWLSELPQPTAQTLEQAPLFHANDVRAEAQRRIISLVGAADIVGCLIKQHNAQMRATELTLIKAAGGSWTPEQAAEAAALQSMADQIKAIRAASNVLEPNPPSDFTDDSHWP